MAPRRSVRSAKTVNATNYTNVALCDVLCPICRCILVQPVTLPCSHDFCLPCFDGTLANANLTCPLCRVRFGSWHRIAKKENKVVNEKLWDVVRVKFPTQVKNRLQGIEECCYEEEKVIKLTTPGEIRKEYELQKRKEEEELRRRKELEEKASTELIRKLKEQEDYEAALREEKLRLDEQVARQIAKEMGFVTKTSKKKDERPFDKFLKKMNAQQPPKQHAEKPVAQLLANIINKEKTGGSKQKNLMNFVTEVTDSNDSIENECRYFKPIDHRNIPPSKTGTIVKVPAVVKRPTAATIGCPNGNVQFTHNVIKSAFARFEDSSPILHASVLNAPTASPSKTTASRKRKTSENHVKTASNVVRKKLDLASEPPSEPPPKLPRKRPSLRSSTETSDDAAPPKNNGQKGVISLDRIKQEREDLAYAKKLQEQFNKERYLTRSSITCGKNVKAVRQATLKEIMSTSKCK